MGFPERWFFVECPGSKMWVSLHWFENNLVFQFHKMLPDPQNSSGRIWIKGTSCFIEHFGMIPFSSCYIYFGLFYIKFSHATSTQEENFTEVVGILMLVFSCMLTLMRKLFYLTDSSVSVGETEFKIEESIFARLTEPF